MLIAIDLAGTILVTVSLDYRSTHSLSLNTILAVIYIDQPIGTGLSHGTENVNSTYAAAPQFWSAFQTLLETKDFKKFKSRE